MSHRMFCGTLFVLFTWIVGPAQSAPCSGFEVEIVAGQPDNFALPTEPPSQSAMLSSFLTAYWPQPPTRDFDETGIDLALGHSFAGWSGGVCAATLELHVRADASLSDNDSFRLGYTGSIVVADAFTYWSTFRYLLGGTGTWAPGSEATITVDLANLPARPGFPTNILPELQDGELELVIEDDTSIDYAILRVCVCTVGVDDGTWGRVKTRYR